MPFLTDNSDLRGHAAELEHETDSNGATGRARVPRKYWVQDRHGRAVGLFPDRETAGYAVRALDINRPDDAPHLKVPQ